MLDHDKPHYVACSLAVTGFHCLKTRIIACVLLTIALETALYRGESNLFLPNPFTLLQTELSVLSESAYDQNCLVHIFDSGS